MGARGIRVYRKTPVKQGTAKNKKGYAATLVRRVVPKGSNTMFRPATQKPRLMPRPQ